MLGTTKVCAISLATVDGMLEANYLRAARLVEIALSDGPDIILLPEAFAAGYCGGDLARYAESRTDATLQRFRQLSQKGNCMVVLGFLEKCADGIRNSVVIYDQGEEVGVHCKRTLWPDANRKYRDEISLMVPGKEMEIFDTRLGQCSVVICYENMVEENWAEIGTQVDFVLSLTTARETRLTTTCRSHGSTESLLFGPIERARSGRATTICRTSARRAWSPPTERLLPGP